MKTWPPGMAEAADAGCDSIPSSSPSGMPFPCGLLGMFGDEREVGNKSRVGVEKPRPLWWPEWLKQHYTMKIIDLPMSRPRKGNAA
jgi:hypothetical protein